MLTAGKRELAMLAMSVALVALAGCGSPGVATPTPTPSRPGPALVQVTHASCHLIDGRLGPLQPLESHGLRRCQVLLLRQCLRRLLDGCALSIDLHQAGSLRVFSLAASGFLAGWCRRGVAGLPRFDGSGSGRT